MQKRDRTVKIAKAAAGLLAAAAAVTALTYKEASYMIFKNLTAKKLKQSR